MGPKKWAGLNPRSNLHIQQIGNTRWNKHLTVQATNGGAKQMSSTGKNRCTSVTAGGKPCGAPPRAGTDRCFQHGASPEERSEAGRLGALVLRSRRQATKLEQAVGQAAPNRQCLEHIRRLVRVIQLRQPEPDAPEPQAERGDCYPSE